MASPISASCSRRRDEAHTISHRPLDSCNAVPAPQTPLEGERGGGGDGSFARQLPAISNRARTTSMEDDGGEKAPRAWLIRLWRGQWLEIMGQGATRNQDLARFPRQPARPAPRAAWKGSRGGQSFLKQLEGRKSGLEWATLACVIWTASSAIAGRSPTPVAKLTSPLSE